MRADLTSSFIAAMESASREPRQYAIFHFSAGNIYVSDAAYTDLEAKISQTLLPLVVSWGTLSDADIQRMTIKLWNGGTTPFSDNFTAQEPETAEVSIYQWFVGVDTPALIGTFIMYNPIEMSEASSTIDIELVSLDFLHN